MTSNVANSLLSILSSYGLSALNTLKVFPGNGSRIILSSDIAVFKKKDNNLTFSENVILKSGNDIRLTAPKISTELDRILIKANGPVNGFFSNSNIKAGQLEISRENISSGIVISFTKGVEMIYSGY